MSVKEKQKGPSKDQKKLEELQGWRRTSFYRVLKERSLLSEVFPDDIEALVSSTATHHDFSRLLDKGCPPQTAIKILT